MRQRVHQLHHQRVRSPAPSFCLRLTGQHRGGQRRACGAFRTACTTIPGLRTSDGSPGCRLPDAAARAAVVLGSKCLRHFAGCRCRASDKCQREKRKTINGDDLLWAMSTLGFEDYIEPLKLYLHKYREVRRRRRLTRICRVTQCAMRTAGGSVWRFRLLTHTGSWLRRG